MMTENCKNIDNNVVEGILSMLLNPRTLMRFKCVSKIWYAMITNPRFVAKHLSNSLNKKNSTTSLLVKHLAQKDTNNSESENEEEIFSLLNFYNDVVNDIVNIHMPLCDGGLKAGGTPLRIIGHCNGIICLANSISRDVILCNPAIQESKLLPSPPYLQDSEVFNLIREFVFALGFGYDMILNEYKVINIGFSQPEYCGDGLNIYNPPKAVVHTLGTDCWREMKPGCLETETTVLWPELFQVYVNQMCYWLGREQHKELDVLHVMKEEFFRNIIIMFDTGDEFFHYIMLPNFGDEHYNHLFSFKLLVWNEYIALFEYNSSRGGFGMWVMDEEFDVIKGVERAWTKHIDFEPYKCPLAFWKSNEILMNGENNSLLSYNLATNKQKYLPIEDLPLQHISYDSRAIVYVNSIVTVLKSNSVEKSRDNSSTIELDFDIFNHFSLSKHQLMVKTKSQSYSIWAIPPDDVRLRIKKVMEGLRAEFGGPEIEPHITIVGSICMNYEDVLNKFLSLRSLSWIFWNQPEVNIVVTRNFYYQCVSLELSAELFERCSPQFHIIVVDPRPHLSLLYGYLTEEERNKAKEIVNIMDESLCTLMFPVTRLALYRIDYNDTSLKLWEKIVEFPLYHGRPSP